MRVLCLFEKSRLKSTSYQKQQPKAKSLQQMFLSARWNGRIWINSFFFWCSFAQMGQPLPRDLASGVACQVCPHLHHRQTFLLE